MEELPRGEKEDRPRMTRTIQCWRACFALVEPSSAGQITPISFGLDFSAFSADVAYSTSSTSFVTSTTSCSSTLPSPSPVVVSSVQGPQIVRIGYLLAGSVVGPSRFNVVAEMVQDQNKEERRAKNKSCHGITSSNDG
ncbi:hypothetical protein ACH5RR_015559 [Cinchona calisaya]|uniref:Uncharacterized protein n=1 Tax=Cinchona calisaya TaxID=153742 RepID=A0ABD2ZTG2_9GENT